MGQYAYEVGRVRIKAFLKSGSLFFPGKDLSNAKCLWIELRFAY